MARSSPRTSPSRRTRRNAAMPCGPEIDVLAEEDVALVHCPATNALFGGCAYVPYMLEKGVRVGLGTDCATHNLFTVMISASQHHDIMPRPLRRLEPCTP